MGECRRVTDNLDFVKRLKEVEQKKTLYVLSAFGAPAGDQSNRTRYAEGKQSYNRKADRKKKIMESSDDTFFFDCVGLVKGILWGWNGQLNKKNGGAVYKYNGVPDYNALSMLRACTDISTDFSNIMIGEYLHMDGHCGVYIGDGLAIECSPKWKDGVQITACNCKKTGYPTRNWTKHGKLPFFNYIEEKKEEEEEITIQVVEHKASIAIESPAKGDKVYYNGEYYYRGIYAVSQRKECKPQYVIIDGIYASLFSHPYRIIFEDGTRGFVDAGHFTNE